MRSNQNNCISERKWRIRALLDRMVGHGQSQLEIASTLGVAPQYLSDIKGGRRPGSELFARRLADEYGINLEWLLGREGGRELLRHFSGHIESPRTGTFLLPVLPHPVAGDPRQSGHWKGEFVEVAGMAAAQAQQATIPYVLRFGREDYAGRLAKGDLILISQEREIRGKTGVYVVKSGPKLVLARRLASGTWRRLATNQVIEKHPQVCGRALAVLWRNL